MQKVLFIVLDGLGDRPIPQLAYQTPLESAQTPYLDFLAATSQCGMLSTVGKFRKPSSDAAHMALFGLDIEKDYPGRGPIEAVGNGIHLASNDLAFRGNFATFSSDSSILSRRAYRATPTQRLLKQISQIEMDGLKFLIHHIAEHRFVLQVIGGSLSKEISDHDPHFENVVPCLIHPLNTDAHSRKTAEAINKYITRVNALISAQNEPPINGILLRSAGFLPQWPSFQELYQMSASCIANNALYNGVGYLLGMKVILPRRFTNYCDYYEHIPEYVRLALNISDFVFLHFQETDLFGEDGDWKSKKMILEKIDVVISTLQKEIDNLCLVVTADHSTPCCLKGHSGDEVPIMIRSGNGRFDSVKEFTEIACANGSLGHLCGKDIMPLIMNVTNRSHLIGG